MNSIKTATQVKDKIKNIYAKTGIEPQFLQRNYMIERLLKRISLSNYHDNFILKGGLLIAYWVGFESRATMDLDGTIRNYPLNKDSMRIMFDEIIAIDSDDNIKFEIKSIESINLESEYGGLRIFIFAYLDKMRIPLKVDVTIGDSVTPAPIEFIHELMFSGEKIALLSYNLETVFAEKLHSIIYHSTANTRMRDFYDIYMLYRLYRDKMDFNLIKIALANTCITRETSFSDEEIYDILQAIEENNEICKLWNNYCAKNAYAIGIEWKETLNIARSLIC